MTCEKAPTKGAVQQIVAAVPGTAGVHLLAIAVLFGRTICSFLTQPWSCQVSTLCKIFVVVQWVSRGAFIYPLHLSEWMKTPKRLLTHRARDDQAMQDVKDYVGAER